MCSVASWLPGKPDIDTAQIPGVAAMGEPISKDKEDFDYFSELASRVLGEQAWGLIAAALGNMTNRRDFRNNFWFTDQKADPPIIGMLDILKVAERATTTELERAEILHRAGRRHPIPIRWDGPLAD
jgi:hypothetical protein